MPKDKIYKIGIGINEDSLSKIEKQLGDTIRPFKDAMKNIEVNGLTGENKSKVKAELTSLFKITEKQAKALQDMINGVIPSDDKSISNLKNNVQNLVTFMTDAMHQMEKMGASTDWMKNGVSFVDAFTHMKSTLDTTETAIDGLREGINSLNESFKIFKDALLATNPDAFGKRFGAEIRATTDAIKKAKDIIKKLEANDHKGIQSALKIKKEDDLYSYSSDDINEIKEYHADIESEIIHHLSTITKIEAEYTNKKGSPYNNKAYREAIHGLYVELKNFENLTNAGGFANAFSAANSQSTEDIKKVTAEITSAADQASKKIKDALQEVGSVELEITIPDASSAEFASKINAFIDKASKEFKKKPIEINLDLANPFKNAKEIKENTVRGKNIKGLKEVFGKIAEEEGVVVGESLNGLDTTDTSKIVEDIIKSFNKVYSAVKTGQSTITQATTKWRQEMQKALTLKATFDGVDAKSEASSMLIEIQNYLEEHPVEIDIDVDTDTLIREIQEALNGINLDVNLNAGNIGASNQINGAQASQLLHLLSGIRFTEGNDNTAEHREKTRAPSKSEAIVSKNADAVKESTTAQKILADEIRRLNGSIEANNKSIQMSEEMNQQREANAASRSGEIKELVDKIGRQEAARTEKSYKRQKKISDRAEAEKELEDAGDIYRKNRVSIQNAIKDGNVEEIEKEYNIAIQSLSDEKKALLDKIDKVTETIKQEIDPHQQRLNEIDKVLNAKATELDEEEFNLVAAPLKAEKNLLLNKIAKAWKKVQPYKQEVENIDKLLNGNEDHGQAVLDIMLRNYKIQQEALRKKISEFQNEIDKLSNDIASTWRTQDAFKADVDKITQEDAVERSERLIKTRTSEKNRAEKRKANIQKVLDNDENPAILVYDEVKKFWTQSYKAIERNRKEIESDNKNLAKLSEDSEEYQKLYQEIQKKKNTVDTWEKRQYLMTQKGLGTHLDKNDNGQSIVLALEDVLKSFTVESITAILKKSPTLSDELSKNRDITGISSLKNIAYYANVAQSALGFKTQTEKEYVDEKVLQAKFIEVFRINEFLNKINNLFPRGGSIIKAADVEEFIKVFEKIPELSKSINPAKVYLEELNKIAEQDKDGGFKEFKDAGLENKYFSGRAQSLWGDLSDSIKNTLVKVLSTKEIDANDFHNVEETNAIKIFSKIKDAYKNGLFNDIKSDDASYNKLIDLMKQSLSVDAAKDNLQTSLKSATSSFEGKLRSVLFGSLDMKEPISVKIVDDHGNERIYDIHGKGKGKLDSDRSFTTNSKSLNQFLNISGLKKQIADIVYAMFEDPDLARTLTDNLFADGKVSLANKRDAFTPKSSQKYGFEKTPLNEYIKNEGKIKQEKERLASQIKDIKSGKYDENFKSELNRLREQKTKELQKDTSKQYTEEELKKALDQYETEAIGKIINGLQKRLDGLKNIDLTDDQIVDSLVALYDDVQIAEAKIKQFNIDAGKNYRKSKSLNKDGEDSKHYKRFLNNQKNEAFKKGYNPQLMQSKLDIANELGLMDTNELSKLLSQYQDFYDEAKRIGDLEKEGKANKDDVDSAWKKVREARTKLINTYYETEGWYLTDVAKSQIETAESEIKRMNKDSSDDEIALVLQAKKENIANNLKGKTDAQLLSEKYKKASEIDKSTAEAESNILKQKKDTLASLAERYKINVETLAAERNLTRINQEDLFEIKNVTNDTTQKPDISRQRHDSMPISNFVGALNTSNLATESTLRGVYELLNGGPPKSGWGSSNNKILNEDMDVSDRDISTQSNEAKFISSLTGLINRMSVRKTEAAAFIGKEGQIGSLVEGTKKKVSANKVSVALAEQVKDVLAVLHNHPSNMSALSQGDLRAGFAKAYGKGAYSGTKPVKVSGSIANGILTSINFDGIEESVAQQIIDYYNELLKKLPEQFGDVFSFDGDTLTISKDAVEDAESLAGISNILNAVIKSAFEKFGHGDAFQQVGIENIGAWRDGIIAKAQQSVTETIVESGANDAIAAVAALETNASNTVKTSIPSLENFNSSTTKELAQYIGYNFKDDKGKNIPGSKQVSAAMHSLSKLDIFSNDFIASDDNNEALAKAWSQLENDVAKQFVDQLNEDIQAYIQLLQFKLQEVADANGLDYKAINSVVGARKIAAQNIVGTKLTKESVEETNKYLETLTAKNKDGKDVKQAGVKRAKNGLKNVYNVLSNGKKTLTDSDLRDLGTGYYQLVETLNHDISKKFSEDVKQLFIQARDAASAALEKYGVKVYGSTNLQNKIITEETNGLIKNGKVGHKLNSMYEPAIVRTKIEDDGSSQDKVLQKAKGRVEIEKEINKAKKEQNKLSSEAAKKAEEVAMSAQKHASAEEKTTEQKKKSKEVDHNIRSNKGGSNNPPIGGNNPPDNGPNNGGILGLLSGIAKEDTLKSIASILSHGIKIASDGKKSNGDSKKKNQSITVDDAWSTAQDYIKNNYPNFTGLGSLKPTSNGYSIDVFQPKNIEEFATAQAEINKLIDEGKRDTDEFNKAQERLNGLKLEQEKITLRIGILDDKLQVTQEKTSFNNLALGTKAAAKELQTVENVLTQLHDIGAISIGSDGAPNSSITSVQNYLKTLNELEHYRNNLSPDNLFDPSTQQQLSNFALALQNSRKEMSELIKTSSQLNIGEKIDTDKLKDGIDDLSDSNVREVMKDIISDSIGLETRFKQLTPVANELGETIGYKLAYTVKISKREVQEMTAVLNPLTNELRVQRGAITEVDTGWQAFFKGLKGKFSSIMQYLVSITSIQDFFRYISQGIQYVRDIDSALTELKKVTDETDESYAGFLQDMSKTGNIVGATISNLTTMAAEWARLGYSMKEAGELAKNTAILMNVSEFDDATEASEALISTMQAFQYTADESQHVVDILNEVGNNYAVSSDGIATALQDSASALMEAGNDLEQSVALVAAANKVVFLCHAAIVIWWLSR